MLLRLNEKPTNSIAVIDSAQQQLTYGELVDFSNTIKQHIPQRTLIFVLAENNVGGIAWTISSIATTIVSDTIAAKDLPSIADMAKT